MKKILTDIKWPKHEVPNFEFCTTGEIVAEVMELICELHDETSKAQPDTIIVERILEDLDALVSDYRRAGGGGGAA